MKTTRGAVVVSAVEIRDDREVLVPAGVTGEVVRAPTRKSPTIGVRFASGRTLWCRSEELGTVEAL